jgi:serine/threonine protein kinase
MLNSTRCPNCFNEKNRCNCDFQVEQFKNNDNCLPLFTALDRGRYYVGRVIGRGGFGVVYAGYDSALESLIAIKEFFPTQNQLASRNNDRITVNPHPNHIDDFFYWRKQFLKEARLLHKLNDPSIIRLHNILENENATTYLIMERLDGNTLSEYLGGFNQIDNLIRFNKTLSINETKTIFTAAIQALIVLHNHNEGAIIHLDINPNNIFLLSPQVSKLKLLDFGLARSNIQSQYGDNNVIVGHPAFMAPEQIKLDENNPITTSADCYSLGACMYAALSGQAPTTLARLAGTPLTTLPLSSDESLIETIMICLNLDATKRPQHAMELNECLKNSNVRSKYLIKKSQITAPIESGHTILLKLPPTDNVEINDPVIKSNDIFETKINTEPNIKPTIKPKRLFTKSVLIFLLLITIIIGISVIHCYLTFPSFNLRYQVNNDGTVLDIYNGLLWKRCSEGQIWNDNTCQGLATAMSWHEIMLDGKQKNWHKFAGKSGWRIPMVNELNSLVVCENNNGCNTNIIDDYNEYNQAAIDKKLFPNTPPTWFWSMSTVGSDSKNSQVVFFKNGKSYWLNHNNLGYVRLVRTDNTHIYNLNKVFLYCKYVLQNWST